MQPSALSFCSCSCAPCPDGLISPCRTLPPSVLERMEWGDLKLHVCVLEAERCCLCAPALARPALNVPCRHTSQQVLEQMESGDLKLRVLVLKAERSGAANLIHPLISIALVVATLWCRCWSRWSEATWSNVCERSFPSAHLLACKKKGYSLLHAAVHHHRCWSRWSQET